jgi:hypothetical protein
MKAVKFLQFSSVGIFILIAGSGAAIMWFAPDKLSAYREYVQMIWPFWVGEVIPALIGTPLTDAAKALLAKKSAQATETATIVDPAK